jgi:transcriptional regulator with XRE-family HTH domain
MSEEAKVIGLDPPATKPIAEYAPRERLGVLLVRYRTAAGKSVSEAAEHLSITDHMLEEVERHALTLSAAQLQSLAAFYVVRFDLLLDAARDWHKAVWEEQGKKGGVQLSSMTTETASLRQQENELELELIYAADELVFAANVARETSIRAEQAALRVRELLAKRGIEVPGLEPIDGPPIVFCSGPKHVAAAREMKRGRDFVIVFKADGDAETFYFCSRGCAEAWTRAREEKRA